MADFDIIINNFEEFGNMIRAWATDSSSMPRTIGQFRAQVASGLLVELGPGFKDEDDLAIFLAPSKRTVSLVLPHPDDLADAIPGPYPLPGFYDQAYGGAPSIPDNEVFRSKRIADYVMRKCV